MTDKELARTIVTQLALNADALDRGEQDHGDIVARLRQFGLLDMPDRKGTPGSLLPQTAARLIQLGRGCLSTSLALTMHAVSLLYMTEFVPDLPQPERDQIDALLERLAAHRSDGSYVANCYAEPGSGAFIAGPDTRAWPEPGGWRVSGVKFGSFASVADFLQFHARVGDGPEIVQFLCPANLQGLSWRHLPPTMGVRRAAPMEVSFDNVRVDDQWRFGPLDMFRATVNAYPFATLLTVAPYVGAAEAALAAAIAHAGKRLVGPEKVPLLAVPDFRAIMAACFVDLQQASALLEQALSGSTIMTPLRYARIDAAKIAVATMAPSVCQRILQACGARGLMENLPFGRLLRDVQAAAHHPPSLAEARISIADNLRFTMEEILSQ